MSSRLPAFPALLAVAVLSMGAMACSEGSEGYTLESYEIATGTFTYEVDSAVDVSYDLSGVAEAHPELEGVDQLLDAGPTQSMSKVTGTAEVVVEEDGENRAVTVEFTEANGELTGALGTSQIHAEDLSVQEFTFGSDGKVTSGRGGTTSDLPGLDLGRAFNCPPLPEGGASDGEKWDSEVELPLAGGGTAPVSTKNSYEEVEVDGGSAGTVRGRLEGPVSLELDASLLSEQLQIPNAPPPPEDLVLEVAGELDLTVECTLGIPDETLLGRSVTGSMQLTFHLPREGVDLTQAGVAAIFDGMRIDNNETTSWTLTQED